MKIKAEKHGIYTILSIVIMSMTFNFNCKAAQSNDSALKSYTEYSYHQGFEDPKVLEKIKKFTGSAKVDIFIKEISQEHKTEGKSSLKLEVTFKSDGYYYFQLPLKNIPLEGDCWINFKYYLASPSELRMYAGINMGFPSLKIKGAMKLTERATEQNKWISVRWDMVELANIMAESFISNRKTPGVTPDSCGKTLDGFVLMLKGKAGQSAVIYIDDININGNIPSPELYKSILAEREIHISRATQSLLTTWQHKLEQFHNKFASVKVNNNAAFAYKKTVNEYFAQCENQIAMMRQKKTVTTDDRILINRMLFYQKTILNNLTVLNQEKSSEAFTLYVVDPINPFGTRPQDKIIGGLINGDISLCVSPDEYQAASIVLEAKTDLHKVLLKPGTFKSDDGSSLKNSDIDIRIVKSWYKRHPGEGGRPLASRDQAGQLTPELLLYNDALIKVDTNTKNNYIMINGKYKLISERKISSYKPAKLTIDKFPVKDAKKLLPVDIQAGTNKQFWITFFIPPKTKPGSYTGFIEIEGNDKLLKKVACSVTINKFKLVKADFISSIYYRGVLSDDLAGTVSSEYKTPEQYKQEMINLLKHGVDSPTLYQKFNSKHLKKTLEIRQEAGINNREIFYVGLSTSGDYRKNPELITRLLDRYKETRDLFAKYACESLYIMGQDEGKGKAIKSQIPAWEALHKVGGKVFVAGTLREYVDKYRGILNCLNMNMSSIIINDKLLEEISYFKEKSKLTAYSFPQVGLEDPYIYRRNFGLVLKAYGIQGAMNYAYQHSFNHPYNDFDHPVYKLHCFTYPTADGVIDTIQWEGYREAMDDLRYLQTLEEAIEKGRGDRSKVEQVKQAKLFLDVLLNRMRKCTSQNSMLDEIIDMEKIKKDLIKHINSLM